MLARIFVSYSHRDDAVASALAEHLQQLVTLGLAELWFDRHLELGEAWETRILHEIERSEVILLLVSPTFLASEFIRERELPVIAEVGRAGARVVPVVVAPCLWQKHPYLGSLQAFNQGRPLESPTTRTFGRQAGELVERLVGLLESVQSSREGVPPDAPAAAEAATVERPAPVIQPAPRRVRVDASGMAYKGSQLQTQIYVNARAEELNATIRSSLPSLPSSGEIEWRSPLATDGFREYRDGPSLRALGLGSLAGELRSFWPTGGPRWDALARVALLGRSNTGVVLIEGKSYPAEMAGGGGKAEGASRDKIRTALAETQRALDLAPEPDRWMGRFYQFANRLAHLVWLRRMEVDAWLVHLLFVDDPHGPTSEPEWRRAIEEMHAELRLGTANLDHVGVAVLPALSRAELLNALE